MALTRDFKDVVVARAKRDPQFRRALVREAINLILSGDVVAGVVAVGSDSSGSPQADNTRPSSRMTAARIHINFFI